MERGRRTVSDVTMPTLQYRGNAYEPTAVNRSKQLRYDRSTFAGRQQRLRVGTPLTYRGCPYVPMDSASMDSSQMDSQVSSAKSSFTYRGVRYER